MRVNHHVFERLIAQCESREAVSVAVAFPCDEVSLAGPLEAEGAGVVLGARVQIVLTSRSESTKANLASRAVLAMLAHSQRSAQPGSAATARSGG